MVYAEFLLNINDFEPVAVAYISEPQFSFLSTPALVFFVEKNVCLEHKWEE